MNSLPLFHRVDGQRVVVVGNGDAADAKRRLVERAGGIPCGEPEAHHARLAFIALDDDRQTAAVAIRLRTKGLLVNVTDRPALCDFIVPSVLDRDPVLIAIGTGGASAGLAKHLRLRIEAILPPTLGKLAAKLNAVRDAIRQRFPDMAGRRHAIDAALSEGGPLDPLRGDAADQVDSWLASSHSAAAARTEEIALTSDDPDDLTLRQARWLGAADVVFHDAAVSPAILARARADAVRKEIRANDLPASDGGLTVVLRRH